MKNQQDEKELRISRRISCWWNFVGRRRMSGQVSQRILQFDPRRGPTTQRERRIQAKKQRITPAGDGVNPGQVVDARQVCVLPSCSCYSFLCRSHIATLWPSFLSFLPFLLFLFPGLLTKPFFRVAGADHPARNLFTSRCHESIGPNKRLKRAKSNWRDTTSILHRLPFELSVFLWLTRERTFCNRWKENVRSRLHAS